MKTHEMPITSRASQMSHASTQRVNSEATPFGTEKFPRRQIHIRGAHQPYSSVDSRQQQIPNVRGGAEEAELSEANPDAICLRTKVTEMLVS